MAYTPNNWSAGDTITSSKLNNIEQGIANVKDGTNGANGAKGDKGDPGASVTAIELLVDSAGKVTSGTATLSDKSQVAITVKTTAE
ncbi:phosphoenolpyruvate synthase [Pediococcus acidilactici]|uniref:phosphoenolpyruvate synthase n=1 Tax=Pediococcus acidilactici TaxID=1254 RepID=UPI003B43424F